MISVPPPDLIWSLKQDYTGKISPFLKRIGISHASLRRYYPDDTYLYLVTDDRWMKNYFASGYYKGDGVKEIRLNPIHSNILFWNREPQSNTIFWNVLGDALRNFNYICGFMYIRDVGDYIDILNVCPQQEDGNAEAKVLGNMDFIIKYLDHLSEWLSSQLTKYPNIIIQPSELHNREQKAVNELVLDQQHFLMNQVFGTQFTPRENQCLDALSTGIGFKEAALILNISPKTVEHHLENIKKKSGICSRGKIAHMYNNLCKLTKPSKIKIITGV